MPCSKGAAWLAQRRTAPTDVGLLQLDPLLGVELTRGGACAAQGFAEAAAPRPGGYQPGAAAHRAIEAAWSKSKPYERRALLLKLAALGEQHFDELSRLDTLDMGAPISRHGQVNPPCSALHPVL